VQSKPRHGAMSAWGVDVELLKEGKQMQPLRFHVAGFEVLTAVMLQVEVFWVVTPCNIVVGYQCFGGQRCLYLQGHST
jgi:hypothetical protein